MPTWVCLTILAIALTGYIWVCRSLYKEAKRIKWRRGSWS